MLADWGECHMALQHCRGFQAAGSGTGVDREPELVAQSAAADASVV